MTDADDPAGAALLAVCAAPEGDHRERLAALSPATWDCLAVLAEEQRATALVRRALARGAAPPHIERGLDATVLLQTQEMLRQRAALAAVVGTLAEAGMTPIALKGVRLAWRDYPDPVLRPLRDLDLLLAPADAERAQALLLASGDYAPFEGARPYGIEHGHQLPELEDRRHGVTIELHHRLNARGWREEPALLAMVRQDHEALDLGGGLVVRVPSAHANFLHLVEHATLHHLFDNGPLVLADLHFTAPAIDWPVLLDQAEALGLTRALRLVASIALRHGATWPPAELRRAGDAEPAHVAMGETALLRSGAERRNVALLRRLEQRTGARPGVIAAVRAALRPDPSALAAIMATGTHNPLRWFGYPIWLARRVATYRRAGGDETLVRAAAQLEMHTWLHER